MDQGMWRHGTRRLDPDQRRSIVILAVTIAGGSSAMGIIAPAIDLPVTHPRALQMICAGGLVVTAALASTLAIRDHGLVQRLDAWIIYTTLALALFEITAVIVAVGSTPLGHLVLAAYLVPTILAMYLLRRPLAWAYFAAVGIAGISIVLLQPGWGIGPVVWFAALGYVLISAVFVSGLVDQRDQAATAAQGALEAEARAKSELAALNATLQDQVASQLEEIARLGQLRRFLSPQIADVLSSGTEAAAILAPHRREIAVLFSDLRSYTRFTVSEAPEDVLTSLDEYYAIVCRVLQRHQATIGSFSGDGVMAFLNDPLPHDDPASGAVRIALELHDEMDPLVARWEARGFTLGYGVGIAMGYATLGLLGNEERSDYTAVGPVVNLASRLCAEAKNGQILVDHRTHSAVGSWARTEPLEPVTLKGFPEAVPTYSVVGTASS
jgi:adenylate cyclase